MKDLFKEMFFCDLFKILHKNIEELVIKLKSNVFCDLNIHLHKIFKNIIESLTFFKCFQHIKILYFFYHFLWPPFKIKYMLILADL